MKQDIGVTVISWKDLSLKHLKSSPLHQAIDAVTKGMEESLAYVYMVRYRFGELLIDEGKIPHNRFYAEGGFVHKTKDDILKDLGYSPDPLGMVVENSVEVYTLNKLNITKSNKNNEYPILLNELYPGDFFGVFGTLNYLSDIQDNKERDWYAIAGTYCTEIALNYKKDVRYLHDIDPQVQECLKDLNPTTKFELFKEYCPTDWNVTVVYFPKHFFHHVEQPLRLILENEIFKTGWNQIKPFKNSLLDNKDVQDAVLRRMVSSKNDRNTLLQLYEYLHGVGQGERYVMKPIDKQHVSYSILKKIRDRSPNYFNKKKQKILLLFKYGLLINDEDWGLVSMNRQPILNRHEIRDYSDLIEDINVISGLMEGKTNFMTLSYATQKHGRPELKQKYLIPAFSKVFDEEFYEKVCNDFKIHEDSFVLMDDLLANLIIVKRNAIS